MAMASAAAAPAATLIGMQREEEAATMQRFIQGVQEDMMVALLETVQSAAAACTQICVQRLHDLHQEMVSAVEEAEAQRSGDANASLQAEQEGDAERTKLSNISDKLRRFTIDDGSEGEDDCGAEMDSTQTIEGIYGDWEALVLNHTPTPARRGRSSRPGTKSFRVVIGKEHWNKNVTRSLMASLHRVARKYDDLVMAPVLGSSGPGEILAKGSLESIEAAKPELARVVMSCFPFAGLPESLRVEGVKELVRLDPADGESYTLKEFWEKRGAGASQPEAWAYWEAEMRPVTPTPATAAPAGSDTAREAAESQPVHPEDDHGTTRSSDAPARPRTRNHAAARMLTRGIRDAALCLPGGAQQQTAASGVASLGELRIPLDKESWSADVNRRLQPALQKISEKFENLKVAPIMGKPEAYARGDPRSLKKAKPLLAAVLLEHFPNAELPVCLQVAGPREGERADAEGRTSALKKFRLPGTKG